MWMIVFPYNNIYIICRHGYTIKILIKVRERERVSEQAFTLRYLWEKQMEGKELINRHTYIHKQVKGEPGLGLDLEIWPTFLIETSHFKSLSKTNSLGRD